MGDVGGMGEWRGSIKFWCGPKKKKWCGSHGSKFWCGWCGSTNSWRGSKKGIGGRASKYWHGWMSLRCFVKKVMLKTSKNLQENTCAGISF